MSSGPVAKLHIRINESEINKLIDWLISRVWNATVIRSLLLSKTTDGIIGVDELGECLEAFGYEPDQRDIDFLKKHFDDNGDGNLEVDELVNNIDVLNYHCYYGKTLMREFLRIDQDRDGIIRLVCDFWTGTTSVIIGWLNDWL